MPKFIIERDIPGAGKTEDWSPVAQGSCAVLHDLGPQIQWVQSYVTADRVYCVYIAPSADLIREHAKRCAIPANRINEVVTIIDPTTAESSIDAARA